MSYLVPRLRTPQQSYGPPLGVKKGRKCDLATDLTLPKAIQEQQTQNQCSTHYREVPRTFLRFFEGVGRRLTERPKLLMVNSLQSKVQKSKLTPRTPRSAERKPPKIRSRDAKRLRISTTESRAPKAARAGRRRLFGRAAFRGGCRVDVESGRRRLGNERATACGCCWLKTMRVSRDLWPRGCASRLMRWT